ncbi:MAG: apolipoprotein N-acyltransferase [Desulfobacteraceae bacterium]|nr:apolipoprotein N-acyltransferase [Desulfobacteraceae bacterium]
MGLVPLFFAILDGSPKNALFLGWLFGAVHSIGVGYWVFHALYFNSSAGFLVSLLFMVVVFAAGIGFYFAVFSYGANRFIKMRMPLVVKALAVSCLWTGMEFCRAHFLSGMPWSFLGHSQYSWLTVIQIADVAGVYGISFLIVLTNIAIFFTITNFSDRKKVTAILFLPIILINAFLIYGSVRLSQLSAPESMIKPESKIKTAYATDTRSIAVIQISVSQAEKWDKKKWQDILSMLLELSENALKDGAAIVVWPETTVPFYLEQQIPYSIKQLFKQYNATLVTGGPRYTGSPGNYTFYNSAYQINDGKILNIYNKIHLLPFGEYFPLGFMDVLKLRYSAPRQYSPGIEPVVFNDPFGRFGALICFEVLFPELTRDLVNRGADFIVNMSNDAWFGKTSEHQQHFSMAVFRAVECRRPIARSSNTGISGFVDNTGKIVSQIQPFDQGYRIYRPWFTKGITFYCRHGDLFAKLCIFIVLALCFFQGILFKKFL